MGSSLCFYNFSCKFLRFGENLLLVFERTGDHKIPAKKLRFKLPETTKGREIQGGQYLKLLAIKIGFLGKFLLELKWWYTIQWFKSPHNEEEEILLSRHLVTSLGTVPKKSWDSAVWGRSWRSAVLGQSWDSAVLGQSWDSLGPEQSWYGLGTVQSWDGTVLGQCSLGTVRSWDGAVLGRCRLGTVRSWDTGFGTVVLGQWSWDRATN